jgi:hypothetical protein
MSNSNTTPRTECMNPKTGNRLQIESEIYVLFSTALKEALRDNRSITFTEIVTSIENYIKKHKINFNKSVGWYAVTVKNDMEAKGILRTFTEKGKKLHRLS